MKTPRNSILTYAVILSSFFALTSCSAGLSESDANGDIFGKIVDSDGNPQSGAIVEILELDKQVSSDESGAFSFTDINSDVYTLLARSKNHIPVFQAADRSSGVNLNKDFVLSGPSSLGGDSYDFNVGQTHSIGNVAITFSEVESDSRCAVDVTCVWAGSGRVLLSLSSGGQSVDIFVDTNDLNEFTSTVEALGLVIRLDSLLPLQESSSTIDPSTYNVTLEIN